jgi:hypothetical protein
LILGIHIRVDKDVSPQGMQGGVIVQVGHITIIWRWILLVKLRILIVGIRSERIVK